MLSFCSWFHPRALPVRLLGLTAAVALAGCGSNGPPVQEGPVSATRRFVTSNAMACLDASPVLVTSQGERFVLTIDQRGFARAHDLLTGDVAWSVELPAVPGGGGERTVLTTPLVLDGLVVIGWQAFRTHHMVSVLDLETRAMSTEFETVTLTASLPNFDASATVNFRPDKQLMRGTVRHLPDSGGGLGTAYLALGNAPNSSPHHGWVFALDLDAWRTGGAGDAIIHRLSTTLDVDCGPEGSPDAGLCGGGIWNAAGIQMYEDAEGDTRLYFAAGNGRTNPGRSDWANTLMRIGTDLSFESGCDPTACAAYDEVNPSEACMASCQNVFIPRLAPDEPELAPEDGSCDGLSFTECYRVLDADLGSSGPVRVTLPSGDSHFVQPGKDGALYLVDGENMGVMHQRLQLMDFCGTETDECRAFWLGMFVTHPAVAYVDGDPVVMLASNLADDTHPSGITAVTVRDTAEGPRMTIRWQMPDFTSTEARNVFRHHPGRPVVYEHEGESYVFVVETRRSGSGTTAPPGMLWGVRVNDGTLVTKVPIRSAGSRWNLPLIEDDVLYLGSCDPGARNEGYLDAYELLSEEERATP